jgi:hypothetical protein
MQEWQHFDIANTQAEIFHMDYCILLRAGALSSKMYLPETMSAQRTNDRVIVDIILPYSSDRLCLARFEGLGLR